MKTLVSATLASLAALPAAAHTGLHVHPHSEIDLVPFAILAVVGGVSACVMYLRQRG